MKKIIILILILVVVGIVAVFAFSPKPDENIPTVQIDENISTDENMQSSDTQNESDTSLSLRGRRYNASISFKGFGPGKEHEGSIKTVTSTFATDESMVFSGEIIADMNTISTEIDLLTNDLKSERFFDTSTYSEAKFVVVSNTESDVTGDMTIHGVTKRITVPYTTTKEGFSSTFNIDMKDFGINQTLANEVIELTINLN
ncbi:YceI family protein [Candidatus Nomurabacteria bacterium]|nr:YceI family protein [Candidatus Nomurabacteria bacterium]